MEIDNSPPAKFMKNVLRKDHPDLTEEEIEILWQKMRDKAEDEFENCVACGS